MSHELMTSNRPRWRVRPFDGRREELPPAWQDLNERALGSHPLADPRFLGPLLRHFGAGGVFLAQLDVAGRCVGLALLRHRRALRWSLFQPSQAPLGPMLVDRGAVAPEDAIRWLIRDLPGHPLELELTFQDPEYSPLPREDGGFERLHHATTMGMAVDEPFEAYWANRKKKLRYNLRRYHRELEQAGGTPEFRILEEAESVDSAVDAYGDLESAGWKGEQGTALHPGNAQGAAYREILREFARARQAVVHDMLIDGRLVASRLIVITGGMAVMLKTTFDEEYSRFGLGRVHLHRVLKDLFARQDVKRIEFYTNASPDQLQWASTSRSIYHVNCYRHPAWRRSRAIASQVWGRMRRSGGAVES